jgi:hypothetical protein
MGKGQLIFKGENPNKKHKKRKRKEKDDDEQQQQQDTAEEQTKKKNIPSSNEVETSATPTTQKQSSDNNTPSIRKGSGRITTSGTVVTGYDTKFEKELSAGDAIMVSLPSGEDELRVITMRLSNTSLNLSSPFSENLKEPQSYKYIQKPRNVEQETYEKQKKRMEQIKQTEKSVYDLYTNNSLVYREKTETGSYRIKRQDVHSNTRGDLLEMRSKKTSDKYC